MSEPTEPGYFWFKEPAGDWKILKIKRRGAAELVYITETKSAINIGCLQGEWGEKILTPDERNEAVKNISHDLFFDSVSEDFYARLVLSREGEDAGRSGWGRRPVEDLITRHLNGVNSGTQ